MAWVVLCPDAQYGTALYEGRSTKGEWQQYQFTPNRNMENIFLFKDVC